MRKISKSKFKDFIKEIIEMVSEEHGDIHYWGAQPKDKKTYPLGKGQENGQNTQTNTETNHN